MVSTSDELVVNVLLGEEDGVLASELLILMTSVKNLGYPLVRPNHFKDDVVFSDCSAG